MRNILFINIIIFMHLDCLFIGGCEVNKRNFSLPFSTPNLPKLIKIPFNKLTQGTV